MLTPGNARTARVGAETELSTELTLLATVFPLAANATDLRRAAAPAFPACGIAEEPSRWSPGRGGFAATLLQSLALSSAVLPSTQDGHGHSSADLFVLCLIIRRGIMKCTGGEV